MSTSVLPLPSHMAGFLHELGPPSSGVYSFVSYPSALLLPQRAKYRNEQQQQQQSGAVNIMHDRRVVRGSTFGQHRGRSLGVNPTDDELIRQRQLERKTYVKRRVLPNISNNPRLGPNHSAGSSTGKSSSSNDKDEHGGHVFVRHDYLREANDAKYTAARARVRRRLANFYKVTPPSRAGGGAGVAPVAGRKHNDNQTEQWLEEIRDRPPESDAAIQTDVSGAPFSEEELHGYSTPPPKARAAFESPPGLDKATQILPDDPDLFLFDEEVVIVLEALVGKTLEQSLLEVLDEEEAAAISRDRLELENHKLRLGQQLVDSS